MSDLSPFPQSPPTPPTAAVLEHSGPPVLTAPKKQAGKTTPKWETEARERVKAAVRKFDELWKAKAATSPKSLGKALLAEPVVEAVRKELRRSTGQQVESKEISRLLSETVLRPECFDQRPGNSPL